MGDEDKHHGLSALEIKEEVSDGIGVATVKIAGGLVAQKEDRLPDEGAGNGDALFFAAGELGGEMGDAMGEPDALEQLTGAFFKGLGSGGNEGGQEDVFKDSALGEKTMILEDEADLLIAEGS